MRGLVGRVALACVSLLAVGGGVAYATGTLGGLVGADGTITACVEKGGETKIVAAGTTCKGHEQQTVQWNQQGPKGDTGPRGPAGQDGRSLVGAPIAAGGARCGGNGGIAVSYGDGTAVGDLCNGAPGASVTQGSSSLAGLEGSACSIPGGGTGAVHVAVGANGAISLTCASDVPPVPVDTGGGGTTGDGGTGGSGDGGTPSGSGLCPVIMLGYPNMTTGCDPATGVISSSCIQGFFDMNGDLADGCEAQADGWEPNDSLGTATHLFVGQITGGTIAPAGDVDFYSADVAALGHVTASLTGSVTMDVYRDGSLVASGVTSFTDTNGGSSTATYAFAVTAVGPLPTAPVSYELATSGS